MNEPMFVALPARKAEQLGIHLLVDIRHLVAEDLRGGPADDFLLIPARVEFELPVAGLIPALKIFAEDRAGDGVDQAPQEIQEPPGFPCQLQALFFQFLALGDILENALMVQDIAVAVPDDSRVQRDPHRPAVFTPELDLEILYLVVFPQQAPHFFPIAGIMVDLGADVGYGIDQLTGGVIAQNYGGMAIGPMDAAPGRHLIQADGKIFKKIPVSLFLALKGREPAAEFPQFGIKLQVGLFFVGHQGQT